MSDDHPHQHAKTARRPIRARGMGSMQALARRLDAMGVTPNAVSVASVLCSLLAGAAFAATGMLNAGTLLERGLWIGASLFVVLRLIANLIDGMIAVEGGKRTALGGIYNEMPDRISDVLTLVGLGYASGAVPELGYLAAIVALVIAYIRELGHSVGAQHHFVGPMAKPQRMWLLVTVGVWLGVAPTSWRPSVYGWIANDAGIPAAALAVIVVLGVVTMIRRLKHIARDLRTVHEETQ